MRCFYGATVLYPCTQPALALFFAKKMLTLLLVVWLTCFIDAVLIGPISITENGKTVTRYATAQWPGGGSTDGDKLVVNYMYNNNNSNYSGIIIAKDRTNNFSDPNMYVEYKLLNKTLRWMSDLSQIECSCNAGIFFSGIPGYTIDGQVNVGPMGTFYCDAQSENGAYCWEFDAMEANKYATQITPHSCSQSPGGYINLCDHPGCGTNAYDMDPNGMGPGDTYKINTNYPFEQSITFTTKAIFTTLSQNGKEFSFQICKGNQSYIENMNQAFDYGMAMIFDYWGTDYEGMSWLDGKTGCKGNCSGAGQASFWNISVNDVKEIDLLKYI